VAPSQTVPGFTARAVSRKAIDGLDAVAGEVGGPYVPLPETEGAVGFTHFDTPASEDSSVIVLLAKENMDRLPSQALVRIKSLKDDGSVDRTYLGVVVAGPFAEPDGLRADSPIVVATTVQGRIFLPRYHGRVHAQVLGEEADGQLVPPRFRPRPNSPVFPLDAEETAKVLKVEGDARVGTVVGQAEIVVRVPTASKAVLPRHTGIIGTTGGGKSTTVSALVGQLQRAGVASIVVDVEGEYTEIDQPTTDAKMLTALAQRGLHPHGVAGLHVYHLVGRETSREASGGVVTPFRLQFSDLSPHAVMEILELPEAQADRFYKAYDTTRQVMRDLKIFGHTEPDQRILRELDELETGHPKLTLSFLLDIAEAFRHQVAKDEGEVNLFNPEFASHSKQVMQRVAPVASRSSHELSWLGLIGRLHRLRRLGIFDNEAAEPIADEDLVQAGHVSVIDLSDTDSPQVNNLVIADCLRRVQRAQERAVAEAHKARRTPTPVVVVIEEAHEFLSKERIEQMPTLFQQVARIARRGRKRWLGLVFVTQLPQHLPDEVLGLLNNWVLHKIADAGVVDRLRRSISGLDKVQWGMVPGLAQGQALVSLASMTRPLLVSIDPTPCHLRLAE
jgi:DNA helicase HerA-like ATPase